MVRFHEWARGHRLLFALLVIVWLGLCGYLMPGLEKLTSSSHDFENPRSPNVVSRNEIAASTGIDPDANVIVVLQLDGSATSSDSTRRIRAVVRQLDASPHVVDSTSYLTDRDNSYVSTSSDATVIIGRLAPYAATEEVAIAEDLNADLAALPDIRVGGTLMANYELNQLVPRDLVRAEMIAFPVVFILAFLIFGGLISALLPVIGGAFTIVSTFGLLVTINSELNLSTFALNITMGLGMGLTIDYTLLMLYRYREEIGRGFDPVEAVRRALRTAGRTITSSATIVALSLICLTIFPQRFLYSMGIGGALAATFAGIFATVVLPVLLVTLGRRLDWLSIRALRRRAARSDDESRVTSGGWYRLSHWVTRRALLVAVVSAAVLIVAGLPFLRVAFTGVSADLLPEASSARIVSDAVADDFDLPHATGYALLYSTTPIDRIAEIDHISLTGPPEMLDNGRIWVPFGLDVDALDPAAVAAVREVKQTVGSYGMVGGQTASYIDLRTDLRHRLAPVIILLLMISIGTLMVMTMSVILPLKSALMSALMLSATFGILVLIFQDGRFESILNYTGQHALDSTQPLLLGVIVLALSTDYSVFLLTRIKEYVDSGVPPTEAVALGLQRTGAVVTAAAILLAVAIGAFATSSLVFIKILGVGVAVAVLIDAFLIRLFLVPSLMALLGRWNWWAPAWLLPVLGGLNARVGERGSSDPPAPAESTAASAPSTDNGDDSANRSADSPDRSEDIPTRTTADAVTPGTAENGNGRRSAEPTDSTTAPASSGSTPAGS